MSKSIRMDRKSFSCLVPCLFSTLKLSVKAPLLDQMLFCCRRKWVGGEVLQALAYDVPIPGYNTKNTNSLRLWGAKATAKDFNLFQFNDGQYEPAGQLQSQAEQVSYGPPRRFSPSCMVPKGKHLISHGWMELSTSRYNF